MHSEPPQEGKVYRGALAIVSCARCDTAQQLHAFGFAGIGHVGRVESRGARQTFVESGGVAGGPCLQNLSGVHRGRR